MPSHQTDKKSNLGDINELFWEWFVAARKIKIPISGSLIQEHALLIAKEQGLHDFKASNGWLASFRKHRNIQFKILSGESAGVNPETVSTWKQNLGNAIDEYFADDIFNVDETGLFYRAMPANLWCFQQKRRMELRFRRIESLFC